MTHQMAREPSKWDLDNFHRFIHAATTSLLGAPGGYIYLAFGALLVLLFTPLRYFTIGAAVTAFLVFLTARAYLWRREQARKAVEVVMERNKHLRVFMLAIAVITAAVAGIVALVHNVPPGVMQMVFIGIFAAVGFSGCIVASRQLVQTEYLKVVGRGYGSAASDYSIALFAAVAIFVWPGVWLTGAAGEWMHKGDQEANVAKKQAQVAKLQSELRNTYQELSALGVKMVKPDATPQELRDLVVFVPPGAGTDAQRAQYKSLQARIAGQEVQIKDAQQKAPDDYRDGSITGTLFWLAILTPCLFILMLNGWPLAIMRANWFDANEHHRIGSTAYSYKHEIGSNASKINFKRGTEEGLRVELGKVLLSQGVEPTDHNIEFAMQQGFEALRQNPAEQTPFARLIEQRALANGKNPELAKVAILNPPPIAFAANVGSLFLMPLGLAVWIVARRVIDAKKRAMERAETMREYVEQQAEKQQSGIR